MLENNNIYEKKYIKYKKKYIDIQNIRGGGRQLSSFLTRGNKERINTLLDRIEVIQNKLPDIRKSISNTLEALLRIQNDGITNKDTIEKGKLQKQIINYIPDIIGGANPPSKPTDESTYEITKFMYDISKTTLAERQTMINNIYELLVELWDIWYYSALPTLDTEISGPGGIEQIPNPIYNEINIEIKAMKKSVNDDIQHLINVEKVEFSLFWNVYYIHNRYSSILTYITRFLGNISTFISNIVIFLFKNTENRINSCLDKIDETYYI